MTISRSTTSRPLTRTVAAAGLLLIILGCGRAPAPEDKPAPSPSTRQLGVTVSSPTQPGWNLAESNERETRFERASAVDPAVARLNRRRYICALARIIPGVDEVTLAHNAAATSDQITQG